MTSRARVRATLAVVAATLLLASAAHAADGARQGGTHRSWEQRLQQRLNLTDQQTEAIRKLREQQGAAVKQHMESLRQAQAELRRLVLTQADQAAIQAKLAEARAHLSQCDACAAELDRLHQRVARLKALPALRPPRNHWPALAARRRKEQLERRLRWGAWSTLAAAASVSGILVLRPMLAELSR